MDTRELTLEIIETIDYDLYKELIIDDETSLIEQIEQLILDNIEEINDNRHS